MRFDAPVFLVGMPRSGTTWLSQIAEAHPAVAVRLSPNFSYPLKHRLTPTSGMADWSEVLESAFHSADEFLTQDWQRLAGRLPPRPDEAAAEVLAVKDTRYHDLYLAGLETLPSARAIYIVRNPAAALWSWLRSPEFPPTADFRKEWRFGRCRKDAWGEHWGFEDWVTVTRAYHAAAVRWPDRVAVIRYEDLALSPSRTLESVWRVMGVEPHGDVDDFVTRSQRAHDPDPYSVHKDPARTVDAWRADFPPDIFRTITDALRGTSLERYVACVSA